MAQRGRRAPQGGEWAWDAARERAAVRIAEGNLTQREISAEADVAPRTLRDWLAHPVFKARVAEILTVLREAALEEGIARRDERVRILGDYSERLQEIVRERGAYYRRLAAQAAESADNDEGGDDDDEGQEQEPDIHPGAPTGLMIREETYTKAGKVVKWVADTALVAEHRAILQQAAKELGQWEDKTKLTHDLSKLSDDELLARITGHVGGGGAAGADAGGQGQ